MSLTGVSSSRRQIIPSSPLMVMIAIPDVPSHQRRLETSYTVQLGLSAEDRLHLEIVLFLSFQVLS